MAGFEASVFRKSSPGAKLAKQDGDEFDVVTPVLVNLQGD